MKKSIRQKKINKDSKVSKYAALMMVLASVISLFGLFMLYNISLPNALSEFNDKYYFVKEQSKWIVLGLCFMIGFRFLPIKLLEKYSAYIWIANVVLLLLVLIPGLGITVAGSSRWLSLGVFRFQPSELMKISIIIMLVSIFRKNSSISLKQFLAIVGISIVPILLQPDLGSAILIAAVACITYFLSGASIGYLLAISVSFIGFAFILSLTASYRLARVLTFLNPLSDPQGKSYHIRQVLLALGSGGLFGVGIGKSRQKYSYIPELTTDSIISVIGEEIGLFGISIVILMFVGMFISGIKIAISLSDTYRSILVASLISALALQILVNLSAMVSLIPLTGVTLPFISYGGTSMIVSFSIIGIISATAYQKTS